MRYLLVTSAGNQFVFHISKCAEVFRQVYGGQIHVVNHAITD